MCTCLIKIEHVEAAPAMRAKLEFEYIQNDDAVTQPGSRAILDEGEGIFVGNHYIVWSAEGCR